jgi:hypothetical protein
MPTFLIHRLRESQRQHFRAAPHTSGVSVVKLKDYEPAANVDARSEYDAWLALRDTETPLLVGDILESEKGELRICKYIGFEEARWFVPEPVPQPLPEAPVVETAVAG